MLLPDKAVDPSLLSHIPELITSVVKLLWFIVACIAFRKFYSPLKDAIDSRSLSVDIGGFKLSFPEAAEGLKKLVSDLQTKVAQLELSLQEVHSNSNKVDQAVVPAITPSTPLSTPVSSTPGEFTRILAPSAPREAAVPPLPPPGIFTSMFGSLVHSETGKATAKLTQGLRNQDEKLPTLALNILWVDDTPKNNAYEIEAIESQGGTVETSTTTLEAMKKFNIGRYQAVITDMGRKENSSYSSKAGIDLIQAIRSQNKIIPIFVYTSTSNAIHEKNAISLAGGNGITSSPVELFDMLRRVVPTT